MAKPRLIAIYQMGKVASSSIQNTLLQLKDTEVVQCHFLARSVFEAALARIMDARISDYIHFHLSRQMARNIDVYRAIRRAEMGLDSSREIIIISLSREPISWTRSSIIQDMGEYEGVLLRMLTLRNQSSTDLSINMSTALDRILLNVGMLCEHTGDVMQCHQLGPAKIAKILSLKTQDEGAIVQSFAELFARPHGWFYHDFEPMIRARLLDFEEIGNCTRYLRRGKMSVYVGRYEDLPECFHDIVAHIGLPDLGPLRSDNQSLPKKHANLVKRAFSNPISMVKIRKASKTPYADFFRYTCATETAAASVETHEEI